MSMRARRHVRRPPDLTSLFDVLFIVVFAALIRAAAVENAAAHPAAPPAPVQPSAPVTPPDVATLRQRALSEVQARVAALTPLVIRATREGTVDSLEVDGKKIRLVVPLVEPDAVQGIHYAGDLKAELRLCGIAARQLGTTDLSRYLVIMAPAAGIDELPAAVWGGVQRDVPRCRNEQRAGEVLLLGPTPRPPAPPAGPAATLPSQPPPPRTTP